MRSANSEMEKRCSSSQRVDPALKIGTWKPETVDLLTAVNILMGHFMFRSYSFLTEEKNCVCSTSKEILVT